MSKIGIELKKIYSRIIRGHLVCLDFYLNYETYKAYYYSTHTTDIALMNKKEFRRFQMILVDIVGEKRICKLLVS